MIVFGIKPFWKPSGFFIFVTDVITRQLLPAKKKQPTSHIQCVCVSPLSTTFIFLVQESGTQKVENQNTKISKSLTISQKTHFLWKTLPFPRSEQNLDTSGCIFIPMSFHYVSHKPFIFPMQESRNQSWKSKHKNLKKFDDFPKTQRANRISISNVYFTSPCRQHIIGPFYAQNSNFKLSTDIISENWNLRPKYRR